MEAKHSGVRIVTGKGGVGKTTYATAMALRNARSGRRTLLVELNGGGRSASLLGVQRVGPQIQQIEPCLWAVDIQPQEAMREYALMTLRFESLYKTVFENTLAKRFLRLIPSLSEMVMLGKVWFHAHEKRSEGGLRFDDIVIDAPATGHAKAFLRAPKVIEHTVPPGPLKQHARAMVALLQSADTFLHVVCTPEEMPVSEVVSLVEYAQEYPLLLGQMCINQMPSTIDEKALQMLQASVQGDVLKQQVCDVLHNQHNKALLAKRYTQLIPDVVRKQACVWPRVHVLEMQPSHMHGLIVAMGKGVA